MRFHRWSEKVKQYYFSRRNVVVLTIKIINPRVNSNMDKMLRINCEYLVRNIDTKELI